MIDAANAMARAFDEFIILTQNAIMRPQVTILLSIRLIRGSCGDLSACCTAATAPIPQPIIAPPPTSRGANSQRLCGAYGQRQS